MSEEKNSFQESLALNNILCQVEERDGNKVLDKLLEMLKRHYAQLNIKEAAEEVWKREKVFPTVVAPRLAIPHARIFGLEKPLMAIATSSNGINFGYKSQTVNVIVLILSPIQEPNLHLQIMSMLAKAFCEQEDIMRVGAMKTPQEVVQFFIGDHAPKMPEYLLARDVMRTDIKPLQETNTLREAIGIFATSKAHVLPVVDSVGDLRGVVSLKDLLNYCLPEHILWLENLSPIYRFQPFVDMLKSSEDTRISDIMKELEEPVSENVPAIQLAKLFLMGGQDELILVNDEGRLAGMISLREFCGKFFWE